VVIPFVARHRESRRQFLEKKRTYRQLGDSDLNRGQELSMGHRLRGGGGKFKGREEVKALGDRGAGDVGPVWGSASLVQRR